MPRFKVFFGIYLGELTTLKYSSMIGLKVGMIQEPSRWKLDILACSVNLEINFELMVQNTCFELENF